jgi:hypothetical protein
MKKACPLIVILARIVIEIFVVRIVVVNILDERTLSGPAYHGLVLAVLNFAM